MYKLLSRSLCALFILFTHQAYANDICGSAPLTCNSLHNVSLTVDDVVTDTGSVIVTVRFLQYANWLSSVGSTLFTPFVTLELDNQFLDIMQLSDIDILIKPNVYTYFGYAFIQTLVEYEYQFEWDLRNSDGLPQQLFAGLRVNVNAGARNVIGSQLVVNGFENDLGPQKSELGVSSPCNMQNGNFYYQQTDYAHAGSHLYFQRHYNSLQEVTSAVTGGD